MTGPPGSLPPDGVKQRLLKNKPLLVLGIVLFLVVCVGPLFELPSHHTPKSANMDADGGPQAAPQQAQQAQQAVQPAATPVGANGLTPALATEFVTWWIARAMDYSAATAGRSHSEAFGWMTPQASSIFQQVFWTPQIAQGITQGRMTAAFQPVAVQAEAINPDGSIVVGVTGSLVVQDAANPVTQQIVTDFLVKKEKEGLRICGMYNRTTQ